MSVYSSATGLSSILKSYTPSDRDKAKNVIVNKVRFTMPKQKGLLEAINNAYDNGNYQAMKDFVDLVNECELNDVEFFRVLTDARQNLHKLQDLQCNSLIEALLALSWSKRSFEAVEAYTEFCIDAMVSNSKYIQFGINKLITLWIPDEKDADSWSNGLPNPEIESKLQHVHKLIGRIMNAIPKAFDAILFSIEKKFPYFKRAPHIVAGFMHNMLCLVGYQPIFIESLIHIIMQKMIVLDVNAPRNEIELSDYDDDEENGTDDEGSDMENDDDEQIFKMDDINKETDEIVPVMNHPIAQTLDSCMERLYIFLDTKNPTNINEMQDLRKQTAAAQFFKVLMDAFDHVILPSHNTHHVQFLIFYYCSFKSSLAESFLTLLWSKIQNPNTLAVIRQATVGYLASFLARAKYVPILIIKHYLKELCNWAHQYVGGCDQYRANGSLKANTVFYTVCQAIFYIVAFRSRDLTSNRKNLLYLQSLQLSGLVTCHFNPLRVCLPAVATAFAGVTRAYQLAYCHAILERNARRKLATVYANDTATAEEVLDTFFPFDPYLLKISGARIKPHYLKYQASNAEEMPVPVQQPRKRGDSEMLDDVDDFLVSDKRRKFELAKSQERESQFNYGLSPGFHI